MQLISIPLNLIPQHSKQKRYPKGYLFHFVLKKQLQRCHINYKPVAHIAFHHALVCLIDVLNVYHLDV